MARKCTAVQREISKRWGKAHGYKGTIGGWIYDPEGRPVAQGWDALFFLIGVDKMEGWATRAGIMETISNAYA